MFGFFRLVIGYTFSCYKNDEESSENKYNEILGFHFNFLSIEHPVTIVIRESIGAVQNLYLFPSLIQAFKKFPDLITGIDVSARSTDAPYRQVLTSIRPGVPAAVNPKKHHSGLGRTLRIFDFCNAGAVGGEVRKFRHPCFRAATIFVLPNPDGFIR